MRLTSRYLHCYTLALCAILTGNASKAQEDVLNRISTTFAFSKETFDETTSEGSIVDLTYSRIKADGNATHWSVTFSTGEGDGPDVTEISDPTVGRGDAVGVRYARSGPTSTPGQTFSWGVSLGASDTESDINGFPVPSDEKSFGVSASLTQVIPLTEKDGLILSGGVNIGRTEQFMANPSDPLETHTGYFTRQSAHVSLSYLRRLGESTFGTIGVVATASNRDVSLSGRNEGVSGVIGIDHRVGTGPGSYGFGASVQTNLTGDQDATSVALTASHAF